MARSSARAGAGCTDCIWARSGRAATGFADGLGVGVREKGIEDVSPHFQLGCLEGRQMAHGI